MPPFCHCVPPHLPGFPAAATCAFGITTCRSTFLLSWFVRPFFSHAHTAHARVHAFLPFDYAFVFYTGLRFLGCCAFVVYSLSLHVPLVVSRYYIAVHACLHTCHTAAFATTAVLRSGWFPLYTLFTVRADGFWILPRHALRTTTCVLYLHSFLIPVPHGLPPHFLVRNLLHLPFTCCHHCLSCVRVSSSAGSAICHLYLYLPAVTTFWFLLQYTCQVAARLPAHHLPFRSVHFLYCTRAAATTCTTFLRSSRFRVVLRGCWFARTSPHTHTHHVIRHVVLLLVSVTALRLPFVSCAFLCTTPGFLTVRSGYWFAATHGATGSFDRSFTLCLPYTAFLTRH